jgi:hypothetical protein
VQKCSLMEFGGRNQRSRVECLLIARQAAPAPILGRDVCSRTPSARTCQIISKSNLKLPRRIPALSVRADDRPVPDQGHDGEGRKAHTVEHFVAALSADGLKANSRAEFRLGYPKATEAELNILVEAEEKAGHPPSSIAQAKKILPDGQPPRPAMKFSDWDNRPAVLVGLPPTAYSPLP